MQKTDNICPACGALLDAADAFCPECGARLPEPQPALAARRCPNCGYATDDRELTYCPKCSSKLSEVRPEPEAAPPSGGASFTKYCAHCDRIDDLSSSQTCIKCGREYSLRCDACGALNSYYAVKCAGCGRDLVSMSRANPVKSASSAAKPKPTLVYVPLSQAATPKKNTSDTERAFNNQRTKSKILLVLGVLMLVCLIIFACSDEASSGNDLLSCILGPLLVFTVEIIIRSIAILCRTNPADHYSIQFVDGIIGTVMGVIMLIVALGIDTHGSSEANTIKICFIIASVASIIFEPITAVANYNKMHG